MLKDQKIPIADIYVPAKRRTTLNPETVEQTAGATMEEGQKSPILARHDGARYLMVAGPHRPEARRAPGGTTTPALRAQARKPRGRRSARQAHRARAAPEKSD